MDVMSALKSVGVGLLASNPAGAAALSMVNMFLDDDDKLDVTTATAKDAELVIDNLPADSRERLLTAQINLKVEEERGRTSRYEAMCAADGQETRAKIVMIAMWSLTALTFLFLLFAGWVYTEKGAAVAFSTPMVAFFLSLTAPYAYVVRAYFGDLRSETKSRHAAIDDKPQPLKGLAGVVAAVRG